MGRGRPPKTVEQHKQDGTYQPCRHADRGTSLEPLPGVDCPASITGEARELWDAIVPALCKARMVTRVSLPTLEHAFFWWQQAQECRKLVEQAGGVAKYLLTLGPNTKNALDLALKYEQEYQKIMGQFGDTPVNATRVRGNVSEKKPDGTEAILRIVGNG